MTVVSWCNNNQDWNLERLERLGHCNFTSTDEFKYSQS